MSSVVSRLHISLMRVAHVAVLVQTVGAGLVGASTSAFFEDGDVAVSYEQAGNIMIAGLALQVSPHSIIRSTS